MTQDDDQNLNEQQQQQGIEEEEEEERSKEFGYDSKIISGWNAQRVPVCDLGCKVTFLQYFPQPYFTQPLHFQPYFTRLFLSLFNSTTIFPNSSNR